MKSGRLVSEDKLVWMVVEWKVGEGRQIYKDGAKRGRRRGRGRRGKLAPANGESTGFQRSTLSKWVVGKGWPCL